MAKYYDVFIELLEKVTSKKISRGELEVFLTTYVDCEYIYDTEDTLLSDIYFTLKHFVSGEESITKREIEYFLECLHGIRKHSFSEKMHFLQER